MHTLMLPLPWLIFLWHQQKSCFLLKYFFLLSVTVFFLSIDQLNIYNDKVWKQLIPRYLVPYYILKFKISFIHELFLVQKLSPCTVFEIDRGVSYFLLKIVSYGKLIYFGKLQVSCSKTASININDKEQIEFLLQFLFMDNCFVLLFCLVASSCL